MIFPKRVVFEGSKKSQEINLTNAGDDSAKYVISIVQMRMKEDGGFEKITEPDSGQYFADKYIRFFPRRVVLAPHESQVVKIQLTKAEQLAPGEYRSHFYFRAEPNKKPLGEKEVAPKKDTNTISVHLSAIFGIAIPVIIRVGESTVQVSISDLSLETVGDTVNQLKMKFNRTGNMSVYGDIAVTYISDRGVETQVGIAKGVAVYTPNLNRKFQLDLKETGNEKINYHKGKLHVVYSSKEGEKLAETEILLD